MKEGWNMPLPEINIYRYQDPDKGSFLMADDPGKLLSEAEVRVRIKNEFQPASCRRTADCIEMIFTEDPQAYQVGEDMVFPVFAQNAMTYGEYSDYVNHHGCACCSLTSLLAAYRPEEYKDLRPEDTICRVERRHFPAEIWEKNYLQDNRYCMPVTLYGISRILMEEGVLNRYIGGFRDREAFRLIRDHLRSGRQVIIETSRVRRKNGIPVSINDRKYAGSYHTMILLGFDAWGKVIFTDSATRDWAGQKQRLKRDRLSALINYMFPRLNGQARNLYFDHRWNTGGFILVDGKGRP